MVSSGTLPLSHLSPPMSPGAAAANTLLAGSGCSAIAAAGLVAILPHCHVGEPVVAPITPPRIFFSEHLLLLMHFFVTSSHYAFCFLLPTRFPAYCMFLDAKTFNRSHL